MEKIKIESNLSEADQARVVTESDILSGSENASIPKTSLGIGATPGSDPAIGVPLSQPGMPSSSVSVGGLIDGKTATELMDSILPALLVFLLAKAGMLIRKTELQLTQGEKNTLAPIMQQCLNAMMVNFNNPFTALAVSIGVIYGGKIIEKGGVAWLEAQTASPGEKKKRTRNKNLEAVKSAVKQSSLFDEPTETKTNEAATVAQPATIAAPEKQMRFTRANLDFWGKKWKTADFDTIAKLREYYTKGKVDIFGNKKL